VDQCRTNQLGETDTSSHSLTTSQECAGYNSSEINLIHLMCSRNLKSWLNCKVDTNWRS
jgi:hypothetical protein